MYIYIYTQCIYSYSYIRFYIHIYKCVNVYLYESNTPPPNLHQLMAPPSAGLQPLKVWNKDR